MSPSPSKQAARIYLCPLDQDIEIPEDVTPEWINEHTSFVYLGDETLTEDADPQAVVLYERLDHGHGDNANLLFADLHAAAHAKDQAQAMIDRSIVMLEADRARTAEQAAAKTGNGTAAGTNGTAGGAAAAAGGREAGGSERGAGGQPAATDAGAGGRHAGPQGAVAGGPGGRVQVRDAGTGDPKAPPALSPQVAARLLLSPRALKDLKVPAKPAKQWLEEKHRTRTWGMSG